MILMGWILERPTDLSKKKALMVEQSGQLAPS